MKDFLVSLLLFILLVSLLLWNAFSLKAISEDMIERAENLPDYDDEDAWQKATELRDFYRRNRTCLGLSIPDQILTRIGEKTDSLCSCAKTGNREDYDLARDMLIDVLEDMVRFETLSVESIF